jgi:hypothetical protein
MRDLEGFLESLSRDLRALTLDASGSFLGHALRSELSDALALCGLTREALGVEAMVSPLDLGCSRGEVLDFLDSARFEEREVAVARKPIEARLRQMLSKDGVADFVVELENYICSEQKAVSCVRETMESEMQSYAAAIETLHRDIAAALNATLRSAPTKPPESLPALAERVATACLGAIARWLQYVLSPRRIKPAYEVRISQRLIAEQGRNPFLDELVRDLREVMRLRRRQLRISAAIGRLDCSQKLMQSVEVFRWRLQRYSQDSVLIRSR